MSHKQRHPVSFNRTGRNNDNEPASNNNHNRLSWPQFYQRNRTSGSSSKNTEDDRRRKDSTGGSPGTSAALERLAPDEARAIQRANQIVMYVGLDIKRYIGVWVWAFNLGNCGGGGGSNFGW
ncbi:hypothetical protein NQ314_018208 [Rhamnusium bicolor]|uniref:Uncharacterized protein n=1 Tax=Rhamnusium bicolor TaxID=1586634 RepID=A0AAV8WRI5_9CUCU|nr:hypothetical protein NQ314_018208 [Rhamnusium bicolor]